MELYFNRWFKSNVIQRIYMPLNLEYFLVYLEIPTGHKKSSAESLDKFKHDQNILTYWQAIIPQ